MSTPFYHLLQAVVKKSLREHWLDEKLISEKTFPKLADVVLVSL